MTARLPQWEKTGRPRKGQALTDIGKPLRSINKAPGHPTGPLPGSRTLPTKTKRVGPAPPPIVTIQKAPVDRRYFVADGEEYEKFFSAFHEGVDPFTGKSWT